MQRRIQVCSTNNVFKIANVNNPIQRKTGENTTTKFKNLILVKFEKIRLQVNLSSVSLDMLTSTKEDLYLTNKHLTSYNIFNAVEFMFSTVFFSLFIG